MDLCKDDSPLVVKQKKQTAFDQRHRPALVTTEKNNAVSNNGRPRSRAGPTPRSPSPVTNRASTTARTCVPQRAQSTEKPRPSTPSRPSSRASAPSPPKSRSSPPSTPSCKSYVPSSPLSRPSTPPSSSFRSTTPVRDSMVERVNSCRRSLVSRAPDGLWPSIRSLSSSFQSDSPILATMSDRLVASKSEKPVRNPSPDRKLKPSQNAAPEMKRVPLGGRNASDQSENSKPVENTHGRAIDQLRWPGMLGGKVSSNALSMKSMDLTDKIRKSASLSSATRGVSPPRGPRSSKNEAPISSKGNEKAAPSVSSASLPKERAPTSLRPSRSQSPAPSLVRPASPCKASATVSSASKGTLSPLRNRPSTPASPSKTRPLNLTPSRTRPSSPCSLSGSTSTRTGVSSVLSYFADAQKAKRRPSHTEESHLLRLLYNRALQWRFVNARADISTLTQTLISEDMLYNVWNSTSALRDSLIRKRIDVEYLRQEAKLKLILEGQIAHLEKWSAVEAEHSTPLSGMIEALKASTLRLPVTGGAKADMRAMKNAISSAVDVMQAMGSSICHLLSRVEGTNSLISELSERVAEESVMLNELRELLASTAAMQVQECSLRAHLLQSKAGGNTGVTD